jgi:hypothetical protein
VQKVGKVVGLIVIGLISKQFDLGARWLLSASAHMAKLIFTFSGANRYELSAIGRLICADVMFKHIARRLIPDIYA